MRNANPELVSSIKKRTLELLMEKEPSEIGMREIAKNCGISATAIYHYYKDKDCLFQAISLDCLNEINSEIESAAEKVSSPKEKVLAAIRAFRDWSLKNPRVASLVMEKIKSAVNLSPEETEKFYVCNRTGEKLLELCVTEGLAHSENPRLDVGILVFGLWGCLQAVISRKSEVEYWENSEPFTERFINMWAENIFVK
ncbi:TetR/AcrR family transcriptional regulator [uncultured Treponema sp.]|uniref:TetR/AcrR family transcriptional regulator n=1 Tax=uncultured Treponema sp. TaxID=162155 RepID=UPI0025D6C378|nr:TetR/AcrR family transcriptional regulator [uncultured Treponema sp.]